MVSETVMRRQHAAGLKLPRLNSPSNVGYGLLFLAILSIDCTDQSYRFQLLRNKLDDTTQPFIYIMLFYLYATLMKFVMNMAEIGQQKMAIILLK